MIRLALLLLEEPDGAGGTLYSVRSLQKDIAAQGPTPWDALAEFGRTLAAELATERDFPGHLETIGPAPARFWALAELR